MVYTLEELKQQRAKNCQKRLDLVNSIKDKKANIITITEKMELALLNNNADEYKRLYVKRGELEQEIKAYEEYLNKSSENPFRVSEIVESWNARVEKYNKDFDKLLNKYRKAKDDFVAVLNEINFSEEAINSERKEFIDFSKTDSGFNATHELKDEYYQTYKDEKSKEYLLRTQRIVVR